MSDSLQGKQKKAKRMPVLARPKKIPYRLSPEKYHKLRAFLYNLFDEHCPDCYCWRELEQMHIHHDPSRGAGGGDNRIH